MNTVIWLIFEARRYGKFHEKRRKGLMPAGAGNAMPKRMAWQMARCRWRRGRRFLQIFEANGVIEKNAIL